MTFSLIARCPHSGMFGMVIASSSPAVAARCAHVRAGVGVAASQNITDPALGPLLLDGLQNGAAAPAALADLLLSQSNTEFRQLIVLGATGAAAIHTGSGVLGLWGQALGQDCAAAGNLLAAANVPLHMVSAFETAKGHFAERLMAALQAGLDAGGEEGPIHSAGIKVSGHLSWPLVDLRCDWSDRPLADLAAAWTVYRPQMVAYVQRAENPGAAPKYGVPGDA